MDANAISGDARLLAPHALDGILRVWDLSSGEVLWHTRALVDQMIFAEQILVMAAGELIRTWEAESWIEGANLVQDARVRDIKFDVIGRFLAVLSYRGQASVWDIATAARIIQTAEDEKIEAVDLSADGRYWILGAKGITGCWLWRPEDLIDVARAYVQRNMSQKEWRNFLGDEPFRETFGPEANLRQRSNMSSPKI